MILREKKEQTEKGAVKAFKSIDPFILWIYDTFIFFQYTDVHVTSFPMKPCSGSYVTAHRYAEPFLWYVVIVPYLNIS